MRIIAAIFLGLALVTTEVLHGGYLVPFFFLPALALAAVSAFLAIPAQFGRPAIPLRMLLAAGVLAGYALWRCVFAPNLEDARIDLGQILLYMGVWLVVASIADSRRARWWILGAVLLGATIQSVCAIYQLTWGDGSPVPIWFSDELKQQYFGRFANRARGFFMNPNQLAWTLNVAMFLALGVACWGRVNVVVRILLCYLVLFFGGLMIFTASRGGLVSAGIGVLAFGLVTLIVIARTMERGRMVAITLVIAGMGTTAAVATVVLARSWTTMARVENLLSPDLRSRLAEVAFRLFQQEPLYGTGPGTFYYASRALRWGYQERDAVYAHNDWLQILSEYGFVGLILLLLAVAILIAWSFRLTVKSALFSLDDRSRLTSVRTGLLVGAFAAWIACLSHSLTDFNLRIPANGMLFAVVMGLLSVPDSVREVKGRIQHLSRVLQTILLLAVAGGSIWYLAAFGRSDYFSWLASSALQRGEPGEAIRLGEAGIRMRPDDARLQSTLAQAYYGYESSLQFQDGGLEPELIIDEDAAGETDGVTRLSAKQSREFLESAASAALAAVHARPRERSYHVNASRILSDLDRIKESKDFARTAIRLDPNHGYTWGNYGDLLLGQDEEFKALQALDVGSIVNGWESNALAAEILREDLGEEPGDELE